MGDGEFFEFFGADESFDAFKACESGGEVQGAVAIGAYHEVAAIHEKAFSKCDDLGRVRAADGAEISLEEDAEFGDFVDAAWVTAHHGHAFGVSDDDGVAAGLEPFDGAAGPCGPFGFPEVCEDVFSGMAVGGDAEVEEVFGDMGAEAKLAAGA